MRTVAVDQRVDHVVVELNSGSLDLLPTEADGVSGEIAGSDEATQRIQVETFGTELRIVEPKGHRRWWSSDDVRVRLHVPVGADVTFTTGSGDLSTDVTLGRVVAKSGSGDLRLASARTARVNTGSGDIVVLAVDQEADLTSGSGDLRVDRCGGTLALRTASGDVSVGRLDGPAEAKLASGDFRVGSTTGSLNVRTASGDITIGVGDDLPAWLDLKSGSGDVHVDMPPTGEPEAGQPYVAVHARTGSGDIRVSRAR